MLTATGVMPVPSLTHTAGVFAGGWGAATARRSRMSADGLNRSAADGTRSTPSRRAISIVAVAVMPGLSLSAAFGASMIAAYVTTLLTVVGFSRTCDTVPRKLSDG